MKKMFYRGEEILSSTNTNTSNTNNTNTNSTNNNNQIIDDKNLILNDFTTNSQQNLITNSLKQESQKNISNSINTQYNNNLNNTSNKTSKSYSITTQEQTQSIKRKSTEPHQPSSYNPKNAYHQKPVYSEILSSKCILYIYYKGDLSNLIDEHFKKSMSASASKSSASLSPLSLSSTSPSIKTAKTSKTSSPSCAKSEFSDCKDSHLWSKSSNPSSNSYDSWLYYNNFSSQFSNGSHYPNSQETCWNRASVDMTSFYTNQHYNNYPLNKIASNSTNNQFSSSQYLSDVDQSFNYITSETCNRQSNKTCVKTSIKEEPQINLSNGSFLQAAVAAVINPYGFQNQSSSQQSDSSQYNLSAPGLTSSTSSLSSSLSSSALTQNLPNASSITDGFHDKMAAAAAAAAANQYLSAAAAAVNNNGTNTYCHGKYQQYFDISKNTPQIDCRRSSSSNYQSYGYDFNNPSVESSLGIASPASNFKESPTAATNTQNYASPIWY